MTLFYVNSVGDYIGGFDGVEPPAGSIEVPFPPDNASQKWNGSGYDAVPLGPYTIAKTTPWLRMTDDEADLITGAMQQANARQKAIYDAATYLSSGDPLWSTLHDMIAATLGSTARADELLAPEI